MYTLCKDVTYLYCIMYYSRIISCIFITDLTLCSLALKNVVVWKGGLTIMYILFNNVTYVQIMYYSCVMLCMDATLNYVPYDWLMYYSFVKYCTSIKFYCLSGLLLYWYESVLRVLKLTLTEFVLIMTFKICVNCWPHFIMWFVFITINLLTN
jgi:hypothetical protein